MALITTSVQPDPRSFGFTGVTEPRDNQIPRAEMVFAFNAIEWPTVGVGDLARFQVDIRLPQSYAYSLVDFAFSILGEESDMVAKLPTACTWQLFSAVGAANENLYSAEAISIGGVLPVNDIAGLNARLQLSVPDKPKVVWLLQPGNDGRMLINLTATAANTDAMDASGYFRFLQYDVDQAHHWAVNTPTLVR